MNEENIELTKEQKKELQQIVTEIEAEAAQMVLDYETNPTNLDSSSVVEIHEDSPLLDDISGSLGDVAFTVQKKKKRKEN
jgi:hypothetical protein